MSIDLEAIRAHFDLFRIGRSKVTGYSVSLAAAAIQSAEDVPALIAEVEHLGVALEAAVRDRDAVGDDRQRFREALEAIRRKWQATHDSDDPRTVYPTSAARHWHDGYVTALATTSIMAGNAFDPEGAAAFELQVTAAAGTDREWFDLTGNCGHCGIVADECACTPDDPCGCGPHELRTTPRECWQCQGSGWLHPRGVSPRQAVMPLGGGPS